MSLTVQVHSRVLRHHLLRQGMSAATLQQLQREFEQQRDLAESSLPRKCGICMPTP